MNSDMKTRDEHLRSLGESLYEQRSLHGDVTLDCDGGVIQAHRSVLSASCNYFDVMFRSNLRESNTREVQLKEINVKVMEIIIKFLYTGIIDADGRTIPILKRILPVARMMQITDLLQYTTDTLIRSINMDNYVEFWDLALLFGQSQLVDGILKFINKKFCKFVDCGNYTALTFAQMVNLLCSANGNHSTDKLVKIVLDWVGSDSGERLIAITKLFQTLNLNGLSNGCLYALTKDDRIMHSSEILHSLYTISANRLQKNHRRE